MDRYVVRDDVKYRRERFGCAVLTLSNCCTRFYNESGALIIEACREGRGIEEVAALTGFADSDHDGSPIR